MRFNRSLFIVLLSFILLNAQDARKCFDGIDLAFERIVRTIDSILNVSESYFIKKMRRTEFEKNVNC